MIIIHYESKPKTFPWQITKICYLTWCNTGIQALKNPRNKSIENKNRDIPLVSTSTRIPPPLPKKKKW